MSLTGLIFLGCQVYLAAQLGTVHSAPGGQSQFLSISDSTYLTYQSVAQRDVFLQQIRVIWQNVLQEYQVTNVDIKFLSEQNAQQTATAPNSPTRHRVSYQITGSSFIAVPVEDARTKFKAALLEAGLVGVQEIPVEDGAGDASGMNGDSGAAASKSGQGSASSSSGAKSFRLTDSIILTYLNNAQRDVFLSNVMVFWRNSLNVYQASNVKITLISETDAGPQGKHIHLVKYQITGQVLASIDIAAKKAEVRQTIIDAHLSGITTNDYQQYLAPTAVDSSDSTDLSSAGTDAGGAAGADAGTGAGDSADMSSAGGSEADQQFETTDFLSFSYSSVGERDALLQQLVPIWQAALAQYQVSNLKIVYVGVGASSMAGTAYKLVTYKVTTSYKSTQQIDVEQVKAAVLQAIQAANLPGVEENQSAFGMPSSSNAGQGVDQSQNAAGSGSADMFGSVGGVHTLDTTDAVILTYTNSQQRDQLLQQILTRWKSALSQFKLSSITISFVSEKNFGSSKQVVYRVVAKTSDSFSKVDGKSMTDRVKSVKQSVHTNIQTSSIPGVKLLSSQEQQAFDSSSDNIDKKFMNSQTIKKSQKSMNIPTAAGQDNSDSQQAGSSDQSQGQDMSQNTQQGSSQTASGQSQNNQAAGMDSGDSQATGGYQSQDQDTSTSSSSPKVGPHTLDTTDAAILTYSTTQQRDQLLQQILNKWKAALSPFKITTSTIAFVSEKASGSGKRVVYRIVAKNADSFRATDGLSMSDRVKSIKQTVHTSIQSSVAGVKPLSSQDQQAFDSSSDNRDTMYSSQSSSNSQSNSSSRNQSSSQQSQSQSQQQQQASQNQGGSRPNSYQVMNNKMTSSSQTQGNQLDVTDVADMSYTSSQQRDDLLQQLLNLWTNALGPANIGSLKIAFVSEAPSRNGGRVVTYSVSGATGPHSMTSKQLTEAVNQSIRSSQVAGVKLATQSNSKASSTWQSSSMYSTGGGSAAQPMAAGADDSSNSAAIKDLLALAQKYSIDQDAADEWIKQLYVFSHGGDVQAATIKVDCNNVCVTA